MVGRRITIDSTPTQRGRHALCSGGSRRLFSRQRSRRNPHLPVLSRPGKWGPQLRGLIERYTDGINSVRHKENWIGTRKTTNMTEATEEAKLEALLGMFSGKISTLSKFGLNLLVEVSEGKSLKTEHIPVVMSLRHSMELLEGIGTLLRENLADPAMLLLRGLMESVLQVVFILEKETEQRGKAFMYFDVLNRIANAEKIDKTTDRGKEFAGWIAKDKNLKNTVFTMPANLQVELDELRGQKLISDFKQVHKEYENKKSQGIKIKNWFAMFGGPKTIEQLAQQVGYAGVYQILYRHLSESVHGVGVVSGKIESENGKGSIRDIKSPDHIEYVFSMSIFFGITLIQNITEILASHRKQAFVDLYVQELREAFQRSSGNQYIDIQ